MINIIKQEIPIDESLKNFYILTILCRVTIDVTPCKYQKSKKSDKILIEQKKFIERTFCYEYYTTKHTLLST